MFFLITKQGAFVNIGTQLTPDISNQTPFL